MGNHRIVAGRKLDPLPSRIRTKFGLTFTERGVMWRRALDIGPRNLLPAVLVVLQRGDVGSEGVWGQSPHYPIRVRAGNAPVRGQCGGGSQDLDPLDPDRGLSPTLLFWWRERTNGGFPYVRHACIQIHERPYPVRYPSGSACHGNASEAVSDQDDVVEFFGFDGVHDVVDEDIDVRGGTGEVPAIAQSGFVSTKTPMLLLGERRRDTRPAPSSVPRTMNQHEVLGFAVRLRRSGERRRTHRDRSRSDQEPAPVRIERG